MCMCTLATMGRQVSDVHQVLTFDNVRPSRLTLDELLAGTVRVQVFDAVEGVPVVLGMSKLADGAEVLDETRHGPDTDALVKA